MSEAERYQRAKAIFFDACVQPRERQSTFVQQACGEDADLRDEVNRLLAQDHDPLSMIGAGGPRRLREHLEQIADSSVGNGARAPANERSGVLPERIGRYQILRVLGAGGMGMVYLAEQENPRRQVALKVITPGHASGTILRRFEHEAHVLGLLQHPNIAQIHEAGTFDLGNGAQPFFAMELVQGRPLLRYCNETQADRRARLGLFMKVCEAVEYAHHRGVVHRDLKPANILVDESTAAPQPKILDFGVARVTGSDVQASTMHTAAGQLIGTVAYMSPEQLAGDSRQIDTRSDVYALGAILFELLAGRLPHDIANKTIPESIRIVSESEPATLSSINRAYRGDLDTIVGKAMERDKARRYRSAGELADDVRRHLQDQPILARPPSTIYQFRKFARRNKVLVGGVAAVFLALIAGIITTSWQARQAIAARNDADALATAKAAAAARAIAVNTFLRRMLSSAQPEVAQGRDVLVLDVLDAAASELDLNALRTQPDIEAQLRLTLGETYKSLARLPQAREHLQRGLDLTRQHSGERSHEYAVALMQMADLLEAEGDVNSAFDTADQAAVLLKHVHSGADGHDLAMCLSGMGSYRSLQGRGAEAIALKRNALEMLERLGEGDGVDAANVRTQIATYAHDPDTGVPLVRNALSIYEAQLGPLHPRYIHALQTLAGLLMMSGAYAEATEALDTAGELVAKVYGPDHPNNLIVLSNLAFCCHLSGDREGLPPIVDRIVEMTRKVHGDSDIHVAGALIDRAYLRYDRGDQEGCARDFREALNITRNGFDKDVRAHLARVGLAHQLAHQRDAQAQAEAESLVAEIFASAEGLARESQWILGRAKGVLGEIARQRGDLEKAEQLAREGYELLGTTIPVLRYREDAADALAHVHEALETLKPGDGRHAAEAERWRAHAEELRSQVPARRAQSE